MSKRVVFLDIDGPMIPMRAVYLPRQTPLLSVFDPCAVSLLNKLIDVSGAKIVISSTWGFHGRPTIVKLLRKNKIDPTHLHKDWVTPRKFSSSRTMEIQWWLNDHPDVVDYVAIDDEDIGISKGVKCDAYEGFSWRNYLECQIHLNAFSHPEEETAEKFASTVEYFKRREIWRTKRAIEVDHQRACHYADLLFPTTPPNKDIE